MTPTIAVLVPCLNEEIAIAKVVRDFKQALPGATVYVYDNGSTDGTFAVARAEGAVVRAEPLRGKGNVVRRMFADIEADVYVLVDGDDTYHAASAPALIQRLMSEQLDMVNASRVTEVKEAYRLGHRFGNRMLTGMVATLFGNRFRDILSGYRVFSRRFVKSFPAVSAGFEIETELTVHALELRMPLAEADTPYKDRPAGSTSKLRTFRDGWRILLTILKLLKEERPLLFFSIIFGMFMLLALVLAYPVFVTYERTGLVPRLPHGGALHGHHAAGLLEPGVRHHPRLREPRPAGPQALAIPELLRRATRAVRGAVGSCLARGLQPPPARGGRARQLRTSRSSPFQGLGRTRYFPPVPRLA